MKIVAEIGANHQGQLRLALELIAACARAGADCVKFQTWKPGTMVLDKLFVLKDGPWVGQNLSELYERAHLPWEWYPALFACAWDHRIEIFSSVFDIESLEFLESLNCQRYKIASFELVDTLLIDAAAKTGKPIVISTGMATVDEIDKAVRVVSSSDDITLLKCTSAYPTDEGESNVATMVEMKSAWNVSVGLSDHTISNYAAFAATACGATMIEKHVKITTGGIDSDFSIYPEQLEELVKGVHGIERAMGQVKWGPSESELSQVSLRRSLYFCQDLPEYTIVEPKHIRSARPAGGLPPAFYRDVVGARTSRAVRRGEPVTHDDIDG